MEVDSRRGNLKQISNELFPEMNLESEIRVYVTLKSASISAIFRNTSSQYYQFPTNPRTNIVSDCGIRTCRGFEAMQMYVGVGVDGAAGKRTGKHRCPRAVRSTLYPTLQGVT